MIVADNKLKTIKNSPDGKRYSLFPNGSYIRTLYTQGLASNFITGIPSLSFLTGYIPTVIVTNQSELDTELNKTAIQLEGQIIGVQYNASSYSIGTKLNFKNFGTNGLKIISYGATPPIFSAVSFNTTVNLTLFNVKINATSSTGGNCITLSGSSNIDILNCEIYANKYAKASSKPGYPYFFDGIDATNCTDIFISNSYIHDVFRGLTFDNCDSWTIQGNYITPQAGTAIQILGNNTNTIVERNHIEGQSFTPYPTDTDGFSNAHQSIISIRSSDVTIRQNFCHGLGTSSGIMCYEPDVSGGQDPYNDIILENNVVYDVSNNSVFRIYNLGTGFIVRNNLFAGRLRAGSCSDGATADKRYRYETAMRIENLGTGISDASGLLLHNNILIGITNCPLSVIESNNYCWSWSVGTTFYASSPSGNSTVLVSSYGTGCGTAPLTMEDTTFFNTTHNFAFPTQSIEDWTLASGSVGLNFGDSGNQPSTSLGTISGNYVLDNGPSRNSSSHDVGPYQV